MKIRQFITPVIVILVAAGGMAYLMFGTANPDAEESAAFTPRPAWVTGEEATAHSCADPECDVVETFAHTDSFTVVGTINGKSWNGSTIWYETTIDDKAAFVNNSVLTFVEPTPSVE